MNGARRRWALQIALDRAILSLLAAGIGYLWRGLPPWLLALLVALWGLSLLAHLCWYYGWPS